jgi:hypothetical protein
MPEQIYLDRLDSLYSLFSAIVGNPFLNELHNLYGGRAGQTDYLETL